MYHIPTGKLPFLPLFLYCFPLNPVVRRQVVGSDKRCRWREAARKQCLPFIHEHHDDCDASLALQEHLSLSFLERDEHPVFSLNVVLDKSPKFWSCLNERKGRDCFLE
jgi:hypothetical protein